MKSKIRKLYKTKEIIVEFIMSIGSNDYHVIYGEHIDGYFCCIPNWLWGCEMDTSNNISYNYYRLFECGASEEVAEKIAREIKKVANKIEKRSFNNG